MNNSEKQLDPVPEEFGSYEEAADFWDAHDTTDYLDVFQTVSVQAELQQRHYEVEIEPDIIKVLRERAQKSGLSVSQLVSQMLRQQMNSMG